jgi:hypothetical protein
MRSKKISGQKQWSWEFLTPERGAGRKGTLSMPILRHIKVKQDKGVRGNTDNDDSFYSYLDCILEKNWQLQSY